MLNLQFNPYPEIETERLKLRRINIEDAPALFALRSDFRVMQHIARPVAKTLEDAEKLIEVFADVYKDQTGIIWAINIKPENIMVGNIGFWRIDKDHLRGEIGYLLHPDCWQKGIMSEAIKAALEFGFRSIGFHSVAGYTGTENIASQNILLKHGFRPEAHFREDFFFEGKFLDTLVFGLLRSEWESRLN